GNITPCTKLLAEIIPGIRSATLRHQECQMSARSSIENCLQLGPDRDHQWLAGFLLRDRDGTVAGRLWSHPDHIRTPLFFTQQQRKRQSGLGADRMVCLELCNLGVAPSVKAIALGRTHSNAKGGIVLEQSTLDAMLHETTQRLQAIACNRRRQRIKQRNDEFP